MKKIIIVNLQKKKESSNTVFLVCNKRGNKSHNCPGKARYNKITGKVEIYEKCININNSHNSITLEKFKEMYIINNFGNIDFKIKYYQKLFTKCLILYKEANNIKEAIYKFKEKFKNIEYLINENIFSKLKNELFGNTNTLNIEEL